MGREMREEDGRVGRGGSRGKKKRRCEKKCGEKRSRARRWKGEKK